MKVPDKDIEALLEAARILTRLHVGDYVYNVRDRVEGPWEGSTWEHPTVKDWGWASATLERLAKKYAV